MRKRNLKRALAIMVGIFMISVMFSDSNRNTQSFILSKRGPTKIAVILYDFTDDLIGEIRKSLEDIQNENKNNVEYVFYDSKANETIQNQNIDRVLSEGVDLILLNLVNRDGAQAIINKIKPTNIPVVLFNRDQVLCFLYNHIIEPFMWEQGQNKLVLYKEECLLKRGILVKVILIKTKIM